MTVMSTAKMLEETSRALKNSKVLEACDSVKLRDRKDLLADVLKQEKPELSVGSQLCLCL